MRSWVWRTRASARISPRLNGLTWARGTTAILRRPVIVAWKVEGKTLRVDYAVPSGTQVECARNDTCQGLDVEVNGQRVP